MYTAQKFTIANTGLQTFLGLPFTPTSARFTIVEGTTILATGWATSSTSQGSKCTLFDVYPQEIVDDSTKCINFQRRVGGVLTPIVVASFNSFGANRFKLNVSNASASVTVFAEFEA